MSFKTRDGKTHQSTVVMGENGLAVDSIATIAGSYLFLTSDVDPITYSAGSATVTLPVGNDLTAVSTAKARYTGRYVLITKDNSIYYINRNSIDITNRTFMISRSDSALIVPASIDLSPGWQVAEADIVNRLATTSAAKIDSVEFRDIHFQMQLDGDPVTLLNQDGVGINPATEEKQDDQIVELGLINDELDTITLQLAQIDDQINQDYGASADAIRTASQIGNSTGAADFNLGPTGAQTLRTSSNLTSIHPNGNVINVGASGVDNGNSTSTPLGIGGVFTGAWKDIEQYSNITFMINSNAAGTITVQYSTDGVTVHRALSGPYNADPNGLYITLPPEARYYRVIYTNGGIAQSTFVLQSVLTMVPVGISTIPVNFPISDTSSVVINRSVITGKSTDGTYLNQRAGGVSMGNSTSVPLLAGATFTGAWEDVLGYANTTITSISDVASAADGLKLEYSSDGINVDAVDAFTTSAGFGNQYSAGATARYFRVRYTNGSTNQAYFRLQTIYHITAPKPSTHRIDDAISGQNDAELSKAVITGKNPDGIFDNEGVSGVVSSNSTTAPLGIGGSFQGPYFDTSGFISVSFACLTDQVGTLTIETSDNGTSIIRTSTFNLIANQPFYVSQTSVGRYIRVRINNTSGVAQTTLRLQTLMKTATTSPTALTIASPLEPNAIALNSRSILAGQQENGTFSNVGLSNSAGIKVAITDRPSEVRGRVKVEAAIHDVDLTAAPTLIYTVPVGKTLYVESFIASVVNDSLVRGRWNLLDGVDLKMSFIIQGDTNQVNAGSQTVSPPLPEPIPFTTSVEVTETSGVIFLSFYLIGYLE